MLIDIVCFKCLKKVGEVDAPRSTQPRKSTRVCEDCRRKHLDAMAKRSKDPTFRMLNSKRMKDNNPMFKAEVRAKVASTIIGAEQPIENYIVAKCDIPRETREDMSLRMKDNNPMKNKETVDKNKKTKQRLFLEGKITYNRGPSHHLWKGNLDFNNSCRRDLYPVWIRPIMERDKFKCTLCGSIKKLQVHHTTPLSSLIEQVKQKYNIDSFSNLTSEECYPFVQEVVNNHTLDMGITVCCRCHHDIDPKYFNKGDTKHESC